MIDQGKKSVLGIYVDAVDYDGALARIRNAAEQSQPYSISALAVHGVMTGVQSEDHKYRLNNFDLIVPDGQPVRWALNLIHGARLKSRVYGPELTLRTLGMAAQHQLPVYFYGATPEILEGMVAKVKERFPGIPIAGVEPSKFRAITQTEWASLATRVVESGAKILFVGLGCPRQEIFAYEMRDLLPMPVLAVGAAFAFLSGQLAQAPPHLQNLGLEWLFRLQKEPSRLWRRYLYLNPYYLLLFGAQWIGIKFQTKGREPVQTLRYG